jgi:hypothetical protein
VYDTCRESAKRWDDYQSYVRYQTKTQVLFDDALTGADAGIYYSREEPFCRSLIVLTGQ